MTLKATFSNTIKDRGDLYTLNLEDNGLPEKQNDFSALLLGSTVEINSIEFRVIGVSSEIFYGDIMLLVRAVVPFIQTCEVGVMYHDGSGPRYQGDRVFDPNKGLK